MNNGKYFAGIFNDSFPPILDSVATCSNNYAYWLNKGDRKACAYAKKIEELAQQKDRLLEVGICSSKTISRTWEDIVEEVKDRYLALLKRYHK